MKVIDMRLEDLKPYEKNPRKNDDSVKYVMESIKEFGFKVPIVIDKNNVIVAGHTRFKAAKKLKIDKVPCIIADDLTDEQIKAFRLADNKVGEGSTWDIALLDEELQGLLDFDMDLFGFGADGGAGEGKGNDYSKKVDIPQYQITGEKPDLIQCFDDEKVQELIREIDASKVTKKEKEFLKLAAYRHTVFNYKMIAEYYAHAGKQMQELMERSALVIIDYDDAMKNGYIKLKKELDEMLEEDGNA